jgi:HNH endonuclease
VSRQRGTSASGKPFDAATVEAVWNKAGTSQQHRPLRLDAFGSLIWREGYGNTNSKFGWEIDHIKPVTAGGTDKLDNLRPLQWEHNREKGDTFEIRTEAELVAGHLPTPSRELQSAFLPESEPEPAEVPPGWDRL